MGRDKTFLHFKRKWNIDMDTKAKLLDFDHICISPEGQSAQTLVSAYCIIGFKNNEFYMWKTVDNVRFTIRFCPFCGISALEALKQCPKGFVNVTIPFLDVPLKQRADCRRCNQNMWREIIKDEKHNGNGASTFSLAVCANCGYLVGLQ